MGLQISIRESSDVNIVDLLGRSTGESELLSRHLRELIDSGKRKLLLNLTDLAQIDTSGVGVIVHMHVSLTRRGGDLKLLGLRGPVLDVLTVAKLLDVIPNFENETSAVESFRPRGHFATP